MTSYREYTRELTQKQLDDLKSRYSEHLKLARGGFLSDTQRKRLLRMKKKERETPDSDFWWRIKESIQDSMIDMKLVCDIASEKELQEIFGTNMKRKGIDEVFPLTMVLSSLLPTMLPEDILRESIDSTKKAIENTKIDLKRFKKPEDIERLKNWLEVNEPRSKRTIAELERQIAKLPEQEWRKFILEDLAIQCLLWYLKSGIFKTDSHRRMFDDIIDAITVMSSGKKKFSKYDESFYGSTRTL